LDKNRKNRRINEYKLKRGFKELFGTTVFGFIHRHRMSTAKRLLPGTDKTAGVQIDLRRPEKTV
jgi:AraC-like DNA-binding protein